MKVKNLRTPVVIIAIIIMFFSCKKDVSTSNGTMQILSAKAGNVILKTEGSTSNVPFDSAFLIAFSNRLDTISARNNIFLLRNDNSIVPSRISFSSDLKTVILLPVNHLAPLSFYVLQITSSIKGLDGETYAGFLYQFNTENGKLTLQNITLNGSGFMLPTHPRNVDFMQIQFDILFSEALDPSNYQSFIVLSDNVPLSYTLTDSNKRVIIITRAQVPDYSRHYVTISSNLTAKKGFPFNGFVNFFYTALDSTPKFPVITDEALLDLIQQQTLKYFYDFGHPACGMARERNTSGDIVTTGGSGFGVMALIVGMHRNFITRDEGLTSLDKILHFLETCDRFHGGWPHWMNGNTGQTVPFTTKDDGADLVETSYMAEGLITMRQFLDSTLTTEKTLVNRINSLLQTVEYDWFTRGQNVLYWHWSPDYGWAMNMPIQGYNETLITYIMAASSSTHPVSADVYHQGYARNGGIVNGNSYYGYKLPLGEAYGGPLFFTHYSFLGLNPHNLSDQYANYWEQNVNQSLINFTYCVTNPHHYLGYHTHSWGLTASDNPWGYYAHSPTNDLGVITPTAAVSSLPYTPVQSMDAIKHFYYILGNRLWGQYGFYDAFDVTEGWWADSYIAIDEGPIICMIENYRSGLLWNLFMSAPEVNTALNKLGFVH